MADLYQQTTAVKRHSLQCPGPCQNRKSLRAVLDCDSVHVSAHTGTKLLAAGHAKGIRLADYILTHEASLRESRNVVATRLVHGMEMEAVSHTRQKPACPDLAVDNSCANSRVVGPKNDSRLKRARAISRLCHRSIDSCAVMPRAAVIGSLACFWNGVKPTAAVTKYGVRCKLTRGLATALILTFCPIATTTSHELSDSIKPTEPRDLIS
jgi:hypothetical protein